MRALTTTLLLCLLSFCYGKTVPVPREGLVWSQNKNTSGHYFIGIPKKHWYDRVSISGLCGEENLWLNPSETWFFQCDTQVTVVIGVDSGSIDLDIREIPVIQAVPNTMYTVKEPALYLYDPEFLELVDGKPTPYKRYSKSGESFSFATEKYPVIAPGDTLLMYNKENYQLNGANYTFPDFFGTPRVCTRSPAMTIMGRDNPAKKWVRMDQFLRNCVYFFDPVREPLTLRAVDLKPAAVIATSGTYTLPCQSGATSFTVATQRPSFVVTGSRLTDIGLVNGSKTFLLFDCIGSVTVSVRVLRPEIALSVWITSDSETTFSSPLYKVTVPVDSTFEYAQSESILYDASSMALIPFEKTDRGAVYTGTYFLLMRNGGRFQYTPAVRKAKAGTVLLPREFYALRPPQDQCYVYKSFDSGHVYSFQHCRNSIQYAQNYQRGTLCAFCGPCTLRIFDTNTTALQLAPLQKVPTTKTSIKIGTELAFYNWTQAAVLLLREQISNDVTSWYSGRDSGTYTSAINFHLYGPGSSVLVGFEAVKPSLLNITATAVYPTGRYLTVK